jgi:hypothetical protein
MHLSLYFAKAAIPIELDYEDCFPRPGTKKARSTGIDARIRAGKAVTSGSFRFQCPA